MKVSFMRIRKVGMGVNCMGMGICILVTFLKIKNMVKGHYTGLVYVRQLVPKTLVRKSSNIMVIGGVDFLMAKANIKKLMVIFMSEASRMD